MQTAPLDAVAFTGEMALVLVVLGVTVLLFLSEWLRVDVVAVLVMVALPLLGLIPGREAFLGLSSTAVVSIIAVIIMGRGLDHTGVINRLVRPLVRVAGSSRSRIIVLLSTTIAIISSFMQNVGAAALFLPAITRMSRQTRIPEGQLLMPVGFAAILGGTVTLVGSSPLIMLNDLMRPFRLTPFRLFDVTPVGLALVATGVLYFLVLGRFVLPRPPSVDEGHIRDPLEYYPEVGTLYELTLPALPTSRDTHLIVQDMCQTHGLHPVGLAPDGGDKLLPPDRDMPIGPGSTLAVYARPEDLAQAQKEMGFTVKPELELFAQDLSSDMAGVVEAIVPPHSRFIGRRLGEIRFRHEHHMAPLSLTRGAEKLPHEQLPHEHRADTCAPDLELAAGDTMLMHGSWESFQAMRPRRDLLFVQSLDQPVLKPHRAVRAVACFALATALVAFTSLPLSLCLMTGAVAMVLTRVLTMDEAYQGVDWRTVFLLAGLIPLGVAMERTGTAAWLAHHALELLGKPSPMVLFLALGAMTTAITLVASNVGAAVLLVPLAVDMAANTGADPRMAALVVAVAASNSFILPTHQVNALYMGPGGYSSRDFIVAGAPLTLLFLLVLTGMLALIY